MYLALFIDAKRYITSRATRPIPRTERVKGVDESYWLLNCVGKREKKKNKVKKMIWLYM